MIRVGWLMILNHKRRIAAPVGSRVSGWVDLRLVVITCMFLACLVGRFGVLVLANTLCGLITSHGHILTESADEHDLERHLAAEANCARGEPAPPDEQTSALQGSQGYILNVIDSDPSQVPYLTNLYHFVADVPAVVAVQHFRPLHSRLEPIHLTGQSVTTSPPTPPPKIA